MVFFDLISSLSVSSCLPSYRCARRRSCWVSGTSWRCACRSCGRTSPTCRSRCGGRCRTPSSRRPPLPLLPPRSRPASTSLPVRRRPLPPSPPPPPTTRARPGPGPVPGPAAAAAAGGGAGGVVPERASRGQTVCAAPQWRWIFVRKWRRNARRRRSSSRSDARLVLKEREEVQTLTPFLSLRCELLLFVCLLIIPLTLNFTNVLSAILRNRYF